MVDGGSILPELPGCGDTSHGEQRGERSRCSCSEDDCGQQQPGLSGVCWYTRDPSAHGLRTELYKVTESRHIRYTYLIFCILSALHHL